MKKEDIIVELTVEENIINCVVQPIVKDTCTYAFYLKKDAERIATRWYSYENAVKFQVNIAGVYVVICFVKKVRKK